MKKDDIKALIFAIGLVIFESIVYFLCKFSPFETTLLTSEFDNNLPFIPAFCLLYSLWFIYLILIPFILYKFDIKRFFKYISITIICIIIGGLVFFFYPTTIARNVDLSNTNIIFKLILKVIYFIDTPILCCLPSMHCVLCYIYIYTSLRAKNLKWYYKMLIVTTSLGIVASTLFIKQHIIDDAIAAIFVVIIAIIIDKFTNLDKFISKKFLDFDLTKLMKKNKI